MWWHIYCSSKPRDHALQSAYRHSDREGDGAPGIELNGPKLKRYLTQGYRIESLFPLLKDLPPVGLTYIQDIERQIHGNRPHFLEECEVLVSGREIGVSNGAAIDRTA
jgi:hypothetical protein